MPVDRKSDSGPDAIPHKESDKRVHGPESHHGSLCGDLDTDFVGMGKAADSHTVSSGCVVREINSLDRVCGGDRLFPSTGPESGDWMRFCGSSGLSKPQSDIGTDGAEDVDVAAFLPGQLGASFLRMELVAVCAKRDQGKVRVFAPDGSQ